MRALTRLMEHLGMNREIRLLWCLLVAVVMSACGSRGTVDIGHGQSTGGVTDFGIAYINPLKP